MPESPKTVVIISANIEWAAILEIVPDLNLQTSPYGQWFSTDFEIHKKTEPVIFFRGGWGKVSAAASAQYVINQWSPELLVNLGTCGGFKGKIETGALILAEKTIIYDIIEQMLDADEAIDDYTTEIDLSWLQQPYPQEVLRTTLVSGDRDLIADDIPKLKEKYGAVAGDWESGAIAWVAALNKKRCLILRGVTDLVGADGGEAYDGNVQVFIDNAAKILKPLVHHLPNWLSQAY